MPDQYAFNQLIAKMGREDRVLLATMLEESFVAGVHETLVKLYEARVEPFEDGYEGTPYHDFIGRLGGWEWPK